MLFFFFRPREGGEVLAYWITCGGLGNSPLFRNCVGGGFKMVFGCMGFGSECEQHPLAGNTIQRGNFCFCRIVTHMSLAHPPWGGCSPLTFPDAENSCKTPFSQMPPLRGGGLTMASDCREPPPPPRVLCWVSVTHLPAVLLSLGKPPICRNVVRGGYCTEGG